MKLTILAALGLATLAACSGNPGGSTAPGIDMQTCSQAKTGLALAQAVAAQVPMSASNRAQVDAAVLAAGALVFQLCPPVAVEPMPD